MKNKLTFNQTIGYTKGMKKKIANAASVLGKIKSKKKSEASRRNGKLGGRPKKNI